MIFTASILFIDALCSQTLWDVYSKIHIASSFCMLKFHNTNRISIVVAYRLDKQQTQIREQDGSTDKKKLDGHDLMIIPLVINY